jgi:hypothetical protein
MKSGMHEEKLFLVSNMGITKTLPRVTFWRSKLQESTTIGAVVTSQYHS